MLKMNNLEICFHIASTNNAKYVGIKIETRGSKAPEIIINPNENFDAKFEYYKKAYTDDLVLKTYDGIKIIGFTYGNSFEEIEKDLI